MCTYIYIYVYIYNYICYTYHCGFTLSGIKVGESWDGVLYTVIHDMVEVMVVASSTPGAG